MENPPIGASQHEASEPDVQRLACLELRGGNHQAVYNAQLPGLEAWVSCRPLRPSVNGGDLYYLSVCSQGAVSRITLADVAGHGEIVSHAAIRLRDALRLHADHWDQSDLIRNLNETFLNGAGDSMDYATAFVVGYYGQTGELVFTNAGHPQPLWYCALADEWKPMRESSDKSGSGVSRSGIDMPIGLIPGTSYTQTAVQLKAEDLLVLYTDGISEAVNPSGEPLGLKRLLKLARGLPVSTPNQAGMALLAAIEAWRDGASPADDETVIVLRRVPVVEPG